MNEASDPPVSRKAPQPRANRMAMLLLLRMTEGADIWHRINS
jgi:hypothetical protein